MELFDTVYEGKVISFEFYKQNVMVNATEMAKIFPSKRINDFFSNRTTQAFITSCLNNGNSRYLNVSEESDLFLSKQQKGTWMHRVLALKFAGWLDPNFEVWVYCTIDKILFEHYRRLEQSLRESAKRKNDIEDIKKKLRQDTLFAKLEQLELAERQAGYRRGKSNRTQISTYQSNLEEEE